MDKSAPTPASIALREAGFIPIPRLWIKYEDLPAIKKIAFKRADEVHKIRALFSDDSRDFDPAASRQEPDSDPVTDKEAAWAAFEKQRS